MPISVPHSLAIVAVVALCTLLTRALPFLFFGGKREIPRPVAYLGKALPPAVIATLVIFCVKDVNWLASPHGAPQLIAIAAVVLLHLWKRSTLLSIAAGTALYMFLIQVVFV